MSARVLVVDDDEEIRAMLASTLEFEGFEVETAADAVAAMTALRGCAPDVIVLDVMMPGMNGFELAQLVRDRDAAVPIIFVTAKDGVEDRVRGLRLGGDDYVVKPFSPIEVVARIEAQIRRRDAALPTPSAEDGTLRVGDLTLDETRHVVERAGARIDLSPTEFRLLELLMGQPGHVLSKSRILDEIWTYDFGGDTNIVERFISNLRRKLDVHGPSMIRTVRGFGYSIHAAEES